MGKFSDLQSNFVSKYIRKKQERAEKKRQKDFEKHSSEMQKRGEKFAQELRSQDTEMEISGPVINVVSSDGAVGRVAKELSRQAQIGTGVKSQFTELFQKLRDKNPTLTKRSIPAEITFNAAATETRGALMSLSVKGARQADDASGDLAKSLNETVDKEIDVQAKKLDEAARTAIEASKSATATDEALNKAVEAALNSQQNDIWSEKLKTAQGKMQGLIDTLSDWGAPAAAGLQQKLDEILKEEDLAQAVGDLAKLWTEGQKAREAHIKDYGDARKDLEEKHKALTDRYNKLVKSDAYKALSSAHKEEVKAELQMVNNIMNSGPNTGTFKSAQLMIDDCNATLKDFETASEKVGEIKDDIKRIQKELKDSKHKKARPGHNERLSEALEKFEGKWEEMTLTNAVLAVKELVGQAITDDDSYAKQAETRIEWRKKKEGEVKDTKKLLDKMDKVMAEITKGEIKKFNGNALNEMNALETLIAAETSDMDQVDQQLTTFTAKINTWVNQQMTPQLQSDIYVDNAEGLEKIKKDEEAEQKVKDAYKKMEKDLTASSKANKLNSQKQEYKDIEKFLKTAKDMMKSPTTFDQAHAIINRCRTRMEAAENASPKIPTSQLKMIHKVWGEAIKATEERMGKLIEQVETAGGADESGKSKLSDESRKALAEALKTGLDQLKANAFKDAAKLYEKADAGDDVVKQAREEALRNIHVLKEVIANDPVLKKAAENPFGVGGMLKDAYDQLRHLEYKALIGV